MSKIFDININDNFLDITDNGISNNYCNRNDNHFYDNDNSIVIMTFIQILIVLMIMMIVLVIMTFIQIIIIFGDTDNSVSYNGCCTKQMIYLCSGVGCDSGVY